TGAMLIVTHSDPFSRLPDSFTSFSETEVAGLPVSNLVLVMLAVGVALFFLYRNLSLGREMLAFGANRRAARMSGLSVARLVLLTHGLSGALAATAGLMAIAADHTASPSLGSDWLLASFVAPAIGGTLLSGGLVSVAGTIVGGVLLATISNGLLLVGIDNFSITVFLGAVLLPAAGLGRVTRAPGGAAGLVLGIVCGVINGLLVYWTKINRFVLTLGTSYVFAGINLGITHATPFYHIPNEISSFGQARVGPFPLMAAVTIVLTLLLAG